MSKSAGKIIHRSEWAKPFESEGCPNLFQWSIDDALDEMINGGFGFHKIWFNLVGTMRFWGLKRKFRKAIGEWTI